MPKQEKTRKKEIKNICEKYPDEVLEALLDIPFWPQKISSKKTYCRYDDDTNKGCIAVYFSPDGDSWIDIVSNRDPDDPFSHRFRTYFGGGQSLRVHTALKFLAVAMHLDNEELPQNRG